MRIRKVLRRKAILKIKNRNFRTVSDWDILLNTFKNDSDIVTFVPNLDIDITLNSLKNN